MVEEAVVNVGSSERLRLCSSSVQQQALRRLRRDGVQPVSTPLMPLSVVVVEWRSSGSSTCKLEDSRALLKAKLVGRAVVDASSLGHPCLCVDCCFGFVPAVTVDRV